ncbi:MAG: 23S rRNA (pseudouridine(1915)-N(3))-methyltransferase RlmH [Deltaproteobacteria bacterium]|nr:23S rRNA (pseudouridine(1915)-N(3))-methyltransferase RlmH [Deltaproteobacteria bacterium]
MIFHILSEGREKADPTAPLVADYVSRIHRFFPITDTVTRPGAKQGLEEKARQICSRGLLPIALDERGREFTSVGFSHQLIRWMQHCPQGLLFIIGGAEGLTPPLRAMASCTIALSKMTLPHRFARLILTEQIYRAICIEKNMPYHK